MFEVVSLLRITAIAVLLLLFGCAAMGGSKLVGVQGSLPESAGECKLEFVVADSGRVKMTQPVKGDFDVRVVLSGGIAQRYWFVARCLDGRIYRSEETRIDMGDELIQVSFSQAQDGA